MLQFACEALSTLDQFWAYGCSCQCQANVPGDVTLVEEAIDQASDIVALLSDMRVTGVCERTVLPIGSGQCLPLRTGLYGWGLGYDDYAFAGVDVIPLRGPNTQIVAVTIDGVDLDPSAYQLVDRQNLMRIDGEMWPHSNSLNPNDSNHWSVTVRFGWPANKITTDAVNELACELVKNYEQRASNTLPGVVSLNIQGAGVSLEDQADALRDGAGNLPALIRFLGVFNPLGTRSTIGVYSPELDRGWRLHETS